MNRAESRALRRRIREIKKGVDSFCLQISEIKKEVGIREIKKGVDSFCLQISEIKKEVDRLCLIITQYYATHWRDDDNPEIEYKMRRSWRCLLVRYVIAECQNEFRNVPMPECTQRPLRPLDVFEESR